MEKKHIYLMIVAFAFFGIVLAGTLTLAKYYDKVAVLCGEDQFNSCNIVQNSPYSYLVDSKQSDGSELKIPLSLAGVFFYTLLLIFAIVLYKIDTEKKKKNTHLKKIKIVFFICGVLGVMFSLWFTYIQANVINAFCKYCLVSAINTLVLCALITYIIFFYKK